MTANTVTRRNFSRLGIAAMGGALLGTSAILGQEKKPKGKEPEFPVDPSLLLKEPNVCRGVNTCKGKGKGDHACAGQGACATVEAHTCAGKNECKGKGGCGGYPGQNTCKEKGHCAVPLSDGTWAIARKQFEHLMKDTGKKVGEAPKKK